MSTTIRILLEAVVNEGKLDEYKKVASAAIESVKNNEPDTLGYAFYFNDDESISYLFEEYKDSDAVFAHLQITGALITPLIEMSETKRFEVYGNPSDALRETFTSFGAIFINHWQSI